MSKPTPRQLKAIEAAIKELRYLSLSNDIHSPSHGTSISDAIGSLVMDGEISETHADEIDRALSHLWCVIAKLDECHIRAAAIRNFKR